MWPFDAIFITGKIPRSGSKFAVGILAVFTLHSSDGDGVNGGSGRVAPNPFPPLDVSPTRRFAPGRFVSRRFVAPTGRFTPWTFRPKISMGVGVGAGNLQSMPCRQRQIGIISAFIKSLISNAVALFCLSRICMHFCRITLKSPCHVSLSNISLSFRLAPRISVPKTFTPKNVRL